ncbi:restriction endonuclease subunit S [Vibrio alginolyticus]
MSFDWPEVRLGDYIDSCLGKMLDKKKNKGTLQPYLGNSNVRWGNFDLNDLAQMKFEESEHERYSLESGDLVVCEGGEPGRCAIWEGEVEEMKIQKALHRVRPNQYLNNYYLYYWFLYAGKIGSLEPYFTGTTIKHLTGRALANLPIRIPPLDIQLQCVSVLCSLDKKISHNIKTNQTLEQMAQTIFKSWFVDFDPVKAKMNGEQPEGMDAATASLFPEKLVESELGLIPEGWEVKSLGEVSTFQNGFAFKSKELTTDAASATHKVFKMGNIRKGGGFNSKGSKDYFDLNSNPKVERYLIKKGDLLMSMTDMKNNVALLGHTALMPVSDEYLVNQRVGLIRKSDKHYLDYPFLYYQTNEPLFITDVRSRANSGVQVNLSTKGIKDTLLVVPPKEIHDAFDKQVRAFLDMIFTNDQQSEELASIRDLLLPKLLSGEIELGQAQELAEVE